jgi:hypothetical protein
MVGFDASKAASWLRLQNDCPEKMRSWLFASCASVRLLDNVIPQWLPLLITIPHIRALVERYAILASILKYLLNRYRLGFHPGPPFPEDISGVCRSDIPSIGQRLERCLGWLAVELDRQLVEHVRRQRREVATVLGWDEHSQSSGVHGHAQFVAEAFDTA